MSPSIYRRSSALLEADLGDELIALDAERGSCFGFNPVATSVWRSLAEPKTFDQLSRGLLDEYAVSRKECQDELTELLEDLLSKGLIERSS